MIMITINEFIVKKIYNANHLQQLQIPIQSQSDVDNVVEIVDKSSHLRYLRISLINEVIFF